MEINKLLRDINLNKYEAAAYEIISKKGVARAVIISKEGKIPFGKIYESLGSLFSKGLIEIQNTRPKEYKIKDPKVAFRNILKQKEASSEKELGNLKRALIQIEEEVNYVNAHKENERTFWVTAIGDEIDEMMRGALREAKEEVCMIPYVIGKNAQIKSALLNIPKVMREINKMSKNGVKIRAIFPKNFAQTQIRVFKSMKIFGEIKKGIEIRILEGVFPEPFTVVDRDKVILRVNDPLDREKILAMIKITDRKLSEDLVRRFGKMWKVAKPVG